MSWLILWWFNLIEICFLSSMVQLWAMKTKRNKRNKFTLMYGNVEHCAKTRNELINSLDYKMSLLREHFQNISAKRDKYYGLFVVLISATFFVCVCVPIHLMFSVTCINLDNFFIHSFILPIHSRCNFSVVSRTTIQFWYKHLCRMCEFKMEALRK